MEQITERVSITMSAKDKEWLLNNVPNISSWVREKIQEDTAQKQSNYAMNGLGKRMIFGQAIIFFFLGIGLMVIASTFISAKNLSSLFLMVTGVFVAIYGIVSFFDYKKLRRNV